MSIAVIRVLFRQRNKKKLSLQSVGFCSATSAYKHAFTFAPFFFFFCRCGVSFALVCACKHRSSFAVLHSWELETVFQRSSRQQNRPTFPPLGWIYAAAEELNSDYDASCTFLSTRKPCTVANLKLLLKAGGSFVASKSIMPQLNCFRLLLLLLLFYWLVVGVVGWRWCRFIPFRVSSLFLRLENGYIEKTISLLSQSERVYYWT